MLYGGKSIFSRKETPLSADITYCDAADECPLRKRGKCLLASRMGRCNCIHGRIERRKGYTSRAMKYRKFMDTYESDPMYNALGFPQDNVVIMAIGNDVFLKLGMIGLDYDPDTKGWKEFGVRANDRGMFICDPWMGESSIWVPRDALDVDFFEKVCDFKPRTMIDNREIKDFQTKNVPMIVKGLGEALPDMYEALIALRPELADKKMDHRGRYARAVTLKDGSIMADALGNTFVKHGSEIACHDFTSVLVGINGIEARGATITIPIREDAYVEVMDNDWVCDDTEFK